MARGQRKVGSDKDEIVAQLPRACTEEAAAVEFMEAQRWGDKPTCVHCASDSVYKMLDAKTGERSKRFLWRCHACKKQYTVRIGTVFEDSRIPMRHWCYAFWRACTSKKGASALEIKRQTGLSYRSALFMMHRIRFAMTDDGGEKLTGKVESDETYVGGKAKGHGQGYIRNKTAVQAVIERGGNARIRAVNRVTVQNLRACLEECVDTSATLMTDEGKWYRILGKRYADHQTVNHSQKEYARGEVHCNTAESVFALLKRGIHGIYHNVSKEHLHRYLTEFEFRFNRRKMTDGERTADAIQGAEGKRLFYRRPVADAC
jgi:transposase-like protein